MANGFANRFLFASTKRSKYLPEGGNLQDSQLNFAVELLRKATEHARLTFELKRDEKARDFWREVYTKLSSGHTGLLGAVTSRAEAQVMRLATLYALLDCSNEIQFEHLEAALALWQYCEDSARYIFGSATGDKLADAVLDALKANDTGLTRTQIRDLFNRNKSQAEINRALQNLNELGLIEIKTETTDGRPIEIIKLQSYDKNDKSNLQDNYVVNVVTETMQDSLEENENQELQNTIVNDKTETNITEEFYEKCIVCQAKNSLTDLDCWQCGDRLIKF